MNKWWDEPPAINTNAEFPRVNKCRHMQESDAALKWTYLTIITFDHLDQINENLQLNQVPWSRCRELERFVNRVALSCFKPTDYSEAVCSRENGHQLYQSHNNTSSRSPMTSGSRILGLHLADKGGSVTEDLYGTARSQRDHKEPQLPMSFS